MAVLRVVVLHVAPLLLVIGAHEPLAHLALRHKVRLHQVVPPGVEVLAVLLGGVDIDPAAVLRRVRAPRAPQLLWCDGRILLARVEWAKDLHPDPVARGPFGVARVALLRLPRVRRDRVARLALRVSVALQVLGEDGRVVVPHVVQHVPYGQWVPAAPRARRHLPGWQHRVLLIVVGEPEEGVLQRVRPALRERPLEEGGFLHRVGGVDGYVLLDGGVPQLVVRLLGGLRVVHQMLALPAYGQAHGLDATGEALHLLRLVGDAVYLVGQPEDLLFRYLGGRAVPTTVAPFDL
ncbi:hypothetical protein AGDE_16250 [Angomonas deanei]|nr:hypothetical protein AGDE_16250 [Angomonas deanei]|eukprot:EPY17436.1 hypothetical protein AGDE_16250 [Angomonas deanei]